MAKKQYSMKWKVIWILVFCWLIPFLFMIGIMGVYIGTHHGDVIADGYEKQISFNMKNCAERIDKAIADSRAASYDGQILKIRKDFEEGVITYDQAHKQQQSYLTQKYSNNQAISAAILSFGDGIENHSVFQYNEKSNGSFQSVQSYWQNDNDEIQEYAGSLGTRIGFRVIGDKLYLVRNLVDNRYEVKAVLVFLLNKAYCFESILEFPMQELCGFRVNEEIPLYHEIREENVLTLANMSQEQGYCWNKGHLYLWDQEKRDSYTLQMMMMMDNSINMFPFFGYQYVIGIMLFSLFLMLLLMLFVFRREVSTPVEQLSDGVQRIDGGDFGYQIEEKPVNKEFAFLTDAINRLSKNLHSQFMRIYQEEIALREARIMALQSHINPHFMNNTLEIINWEARLGGNEKVSNMIGALSRLLDSAMDRRKLPEVALKEEMDNVNAYLYIMKERLGDKLTVDDQITGDLLACKVPRLIMQPLIENAIEHGVIPNQKGTITLKGKHEGEYLYLEILNDGSMTQEEHEKIARLLRPDYNTSKESSGNLGIANVNQRLRILFGEPSGLTITEEGGKICSRIVIPWNKEDILNNDR